MTVKYFIKSLIHWHRPSGLPNVVVFGSPRGGTTWLTEIIGSLSGFWTIHEPFNLRRGFVRRKTGLCSFSDLYASSSDSIISSYYQKILDGKFDELKMWPWVRGYHFRSSRIVLKQNQGLLNRINYFQDNYSIKAIHLLRHPLAVSISREEIPLLVDFKNCEIRDIFSEDQLEIADSIIDKADHLECGVLAWCLHHAPALLRHNPHTLLLSYEHMVMQPGRVIRNLSCFLSVSDEMIDMLQFIEKPSSVTSKSDLHTRKLLGFCKREDLISKWRSHVSHERELELMSILKVFNIDIYQVGKNMPIAWRGFTLDGNALEEK